MCWNGGDQIWRGMSFDAEKGADRCSGPEPLGVISLLKGVWCAGGWDVWVGGVSVGRGLSFGFVWGWDG